MQPTKTRQAKWLAEFERQVIAIDIKHTGKIEWDSACYFFACTNFRLPDPQGIWFGTLFHEK